MIGSDQTVSIESPLNPSDSKISEVISFGEKFREKFDMHKKILVLDLDQTLVCLTTKRPGNDVNYAETLSQGRVCCYAVKRPGLEIFLRDMSCIYNIYIYTSMKPAYSKEVARAVGLLPYIYEIFSRPHCTKVSKGIYMKSLINLGFSLEDTIYIDNSPNQIRSQPLNSILIQSFKGETGDSALILLAQFLLNMARESDVRPVTDKLFEFFENKNKVSHTIGNSKALSPKEYSATLPEIREERDEEDKYSKYFSAKKRLSTTGCENLDDKLSGFQMIYHSKNLGIPSLNSPRVIASTEKAQMSTLQQKKMEA